VPRLNDERKPFFNTPRNWHPQSVRNHA